MPNHFHVLVREKIENGTSRFVKKLLTGYSMYFNTKYERSGPLFLHPFRAEHADNDRHLKYLFSYIHLNPLSISEPGWKDKIIDRDKAKRFLENYNYSSFADYMGKKRPEGNIINPSAFPDYFCEKKDFDGSTDDWINYKSRALYQG
jgi:putative transposase